MRNLRLLLPLIAAVAPAAVEFNRDIRPILSDKCFSCHGPDDKNRMAKLRLDTEAGARAAVVPGDANKSVLYQRITHQTRGLRMPPVASGNTLTEREIGLLRDWIDEGARWQGHWSFLKPVRMAPPKVSNPAWPRNAIDHFILARLDREGLKPSPEADRRTLIRRLSFDLTGLPPTPAEVDAFLNDSSPNAYEKVVDRLLQAQRFGERMAVRWLDAARYADTNGYQTDAERSMWRWRDWVIDAFNRNMPFDRFTVEQLAGDLLPNATRDQILATGFNRNHRGNGEGGSIPEEFLVEYSVDRVDTTSTVWMGLTLACSRCHDHKYDPFSQKDFYRFFGFFNNIPEKGKVFKYGNSPPLIPAPTASQEAELKVIEGRLAKADDRFERMYKERKAAQVEWERSLDRSRPLDWAPSFAMTAHYAFDGQTPGIAREGSPAFDSGKLGQAAVFDGKRYVEAGNIGQYGMLDKFALAAWVKPSQPSGAIVTRAQDIEEQSGYGLYLHQGKLQVNMIVRWLDDCLRVETVDPVKLNEWTHVAMTYDGSRTADGIRVYLNGEPAKLKYIVDDLNQDFRSKEPLRIGAGNGMRFHGSIDDVRVYSDALTSAEAAALAVSTPVNELVGLESAKRTRAQADKVEWCFLERFAPQPIRTAWSELHGLRKQREKFLDGLPTVMVMQERPQVRETFVLNRGQYDQPGEKVTRGIPAALPPLPRDASLDRLGLARWLVSPDHPLTARVTVNRFWQMLFGTGIVKTVEDFGSQGEWPVHPELLDWLATEFVRTGWDVKAMMKTMVTSAAYRQSSKATPELLQKDPENRLLARGSRFRLAPEMVRDQALSASGLLVEKLGGPSVKPYQPAGLWKELSGGADYQRDHGENLYRRSMYTYWKRASPPPGLMTFDSAGRETCTVRENRTNTPLQALTLMNDETYLEASRKMAERMMREGGATVDSRLAYGFSLAVSRHPKDNEARVLKASFDRNLARFQREDEPARKLLAQGESKPDPALNAKELAAYASVASLILNLDEAITKE
ncbi:MAG: DUF1553 domain-containing protein [Bryobacteraceae bacterium]|nr:DUF1553 domain-containing protein [Bryobacteraceae bacterium]